MVQANNIISALPSLGWRGNAAPCEIASFAGGHDIPERRVPYVDGAGHDNTGRKPYTSTVKLHFNNTMGFSPAGTLWFPDYWNSHWRPALEAREIGKCQHPVLGTFDARVPDFSGECVAQSRAGIVVTVSFVESNKDTAPGAFKLGKTAASAAADADTACAAFDIYYPDGANNGSIFDAIAAIEGAIFSASLSITGLINQVMGKIDYMIRLVEGLNDPATWPAYDNLLSVYARLGEYSEAVASARKTATYVVPANTTLDVLADYFGNKLTDLIGLNLQLARSPLVPKGSVVTHYIE